MEYKLNKRKSLGYKISLALSIVLLFVSGISLYFIYGLEQQTQIIAGSTLNQDSALIQFGYISPRETPINEFGGSIPIKVVNQEGYTYFKEGDSVNINLQRIESDNFKGFSCDSNALVIDKYRYYCNTGCGADEAIGHFQNGICKSFSQLPTKDNKLSPGKHLVEYAAGFKYYNYDYSIWWGPHYFQQYINVEPVPCVLGSGQILVMDRFGVGQHVNKDTLTYLPVKYCGAHPPLVLDEKTLTSWHDFSVLDKLLNEMDYVVPANQQVAVFYIAEKPAGLTVLCGEGKYTILKDGICIDFVGLVTPCNNGILQSDGTCLTQAKMSYICDGRLEIDNSTKQATCYTSTPVREEFVCSDGRKVLNVNECTTVMAVKYVCNTLLGQKEVELPSDCVEIVNKVTIINETGGYNLLCKDGVVVDNLAKCSNNIIIPRYHCSDGTIVLNLENCADNLLSSMSYICGGGGKEVDLPSECDIQIIPNKKIEDTGIVVPVTLKEIENYFQRNLFDTLGFKSFAFLTGIFGLILLFISFLIGSKPSENGK